MAAAGASVPSAASAQALCSLDGMVRAFEGARAEIAAGESHQASGALNALATMQFPPALGLLAENTDDPEDRAMWARLAEKTGDAAGQRVIEAMRAGGQGAAVRAGRQRAAEREIKVPGCLADEWAVRDLGADGLAIGPVRVTIDERINPKLVEIVKKRFPIIVKAARTGSIEGRLLLSSLQRIEILAGDRYDRYVDWAEGGEGTNMRLTVGNVLDEGPKHTALAMVLAAGRALYDRLPGREMDDPYFQEIGGFRVFTSVYPDVKGNVFLDSLNKAVDMAKDLPKSVRPAFEAVDEIRYNPPSKHFIKFGAPDGAVAYYDRTVSRPGRRVIFVRRDMRWSSTADLLLSIVHEGVHVNQDAEAERRRAKDPNDAYAALWYLSDTTNPAFKDRIRFECEALIAEIETADALGLDPHVIEVSPYLDLCPDSRKALVSWKERRFRKNMDAYNSQ